MNGFTFADERLSIINLLKLLLILPDFCNNSKVAVNEYIDTPCWSLPKNEKYESQVPS